MHKLRYSPGDAEAYLRRTLEDLAGDTSVYILGLGNTDRADDGAGVLVAEALKARFPGRAFSEHDGVEGVVLDIAEKDEHATVFFVDAGDFPGVPGEITVVRREAVRDTEVTTHRVAVALMASLLERAGKGSAVVCIRPQTVGFRARMSKPVSDSVALLTRVFEAMLEERRAR